MSYTNSNNLIKPRKFLIGGFFFFSGVLITIFLTSLTAISKSPETIISTFKMDSTLVQPMSYHGGEKSASLIK